MGVREGAFVFVVRQNGTDNGFGSTTRSDCDFGNGEALVCVGGVLVTRDPMFVLGGIEGLNIKLSI